MYTNIWKTKRRTVTAVMAVLYLAFGFSTWANAQTQESFEEKLRKAVKAQTTKNKADEDEQKRLAAGFVAKREAMQKLEEAELRQAELAFKQRMTSIKQEETALMTALIRELESNLKGNEEQLAKGVIDLKAQMAAKEAESEHDFRKDREAFSQELKAKIAGELAKAEAERERKKQMAITLAMTYFTGGAALPALAATGAGNSAAASTKSFPALVGKTTSVTIPANSNRNPVIRPRGVRVYNSPAGPPFIPPPESGQLDPDWLDPVGFFLTKGFQAARGPGNRLQNASKGTTIAPTTPTRVYSARELIRSAEEAGAYHNFPGHFDRFVFGGTRQVVSNEYIVYTRPGTLNGVAGTFELGVQPSSSGGVEVIRHRFFRPNR